MKKLNVLIACEESQRVCSAFRELGHNAFSCDLIYCSGGHPDWHIKGNALNLLTNNFYFKTCDNNNHFIYKWDLIIAHPPCTYMSKAGARWMYQGNNLNLERLNKGLAAREFFMQFYNTDCCDKVCIENPVPLKIINLPEYSQIIQPYEFGEPYSKKTLLWLKNLPNLKPTCIVENYKPFLPSNTGGKKRGQSYSFGVSKNSKMSSVTFLGIAKAMAEQWGC